ncbi:hypothetical protein PLICRDRAFT_108554 [Plicaturopsis crispa FD-325 SS-3]|nr:hypothetical protein PLICRDRAFT_108554 [Plicaturopsis crispa FD-325 SS-3]
MLCCWQFWIASAYPRAGIPGRSSLEPRTDPVFPSSPPSCPLCAANYSQINSCAQAAPVLANFSMIIFNPGAFIDVIKCACTDTFQSTFPQCVDCFSQTNQTDVLQTPNLPAVVDGMRKICSIESSLLGGAATADGEATPTSTTAVAKSTSTSDGRALGRDTTVLQFLFSVPLVVGVLAAF